jgi:hypothetical protein
MIPYITLKLDKIYDLRMGMASSIRFQQLNGYTVFDIAEFTLEVCAQVIWTLISEERPELTLADTIKLIDENADDITSVISAAVNVVRSAYPPADKSKNAHPAVRKNS